MNVMTDDEVLGNTPDVAGGINAAILSERLRISAITESPEGRRNPEMAAELALRTPMSADVARGILAKSAPANPYLAALDREGVVNVRGSEMDMTPQDPDVARAVEISESSHFTNIERGYIAKDTPFDREAATRKAIASTAARKAKG